MVKGWAMVPPHLSAGLANKNDIIYNYIFTCHVYIIHMWEYCANTTLITLPIKA